MANAICLKCGAEKKRPTAACSVCGFDPEGDDVALAMSILLSIERHEDGADRRRYAKELDAIAQRIRTGEEVAFGGGEVQRQLEIVELGKAISWKHGVKGLAMVVLWLLPLLLLIALAMWLYFHR